MYVILSIVMIIFMGFIFWFYRRKIRRQLDEEMQIQVNQAVSEYYRLKTASKEEENQLDIEWFKLYIDILEMKN